MKTFRNLTYALVTLCVLSLGIIVLFTDVGIDHPIIMYVNSAVFAVALVALCASVIMYFHSKSLDITRLKRRGTRAYGELLQHKMRLIDAMDGDKPVADWDSFLYNEESFPRIRKFLYEEYFLLLSFDAFFPHSAGANEVNKFYDLHKELENFIRSLRYDKIEYGKFRRAYAKVCAQELASDTPEEDFSRPELKEAYDALLRANETELFNVDHLLQTLDANLTELDKYFSDGVAWSTSKPSFDAEFHLWMGAKE